MTAAAPAIVDDRPPDLARLAELCLRRAARATTAGCAAVALRWLRLHRDYRRVLDERMAPSVPVAELDELDELDAVFPTKASAVTWIAESTAANRGNCRVNPAPPRERRPP